MFTGMERHCRIWVFDVQGRCWDLGSGVGIRIWRLPAGMNDERSLLRILFLFQNCGHKLVLSSCAAVLR